MATKKTATKAATPKATKTKIKAPPMPAQKYTHQKACNHLKYDPTNYIPGKPSYGTKRAREVTQEEWEAASAYIDLPMMGENGRCYQRCTKCGHPRYKPGHEMQPPDPATVYHPPVIEAETVNLFDLAAFPMTKEAEEKERRKQEAAQRKAVQAELNKRAEAQHKHQ